MRRLAIPAFIVLMVAACGDTDAAQQPKDIYADPAPMPAPATVKPARRPEEPSGAPDQPRSRREGPTYTGKTY